MNGKVRQKEDSEKWDKCCGEPWSTILLISNYLTQLVPEYIVVRRILPVSFGVATLHLVEL